MSSSPDPLPPNNLSIVKIPLYPVRFQPIYKHYVWGGNKFQTIFQRQDCTQKTAESWEIADHEHGTNIVTNGPLQGMSLHDVVHSYPKDLSGLEVRSSDRLQRFPLLLKYVDAREMTSLHVHPSEAWASENGFADTGKTEAWIILDAEPDSIIYAGFRQPCTQAQVEAALLEGQIETLLNRITPKKGDCFLIEPGTVHAVGKGVLIAEVQQTSDLSFRLFDWNREEKSGENEEKRPLQIQEALAVLDYNRGSVCPQTPYATAFSNCQKLMLSDFFKIDCWTCSDFFIWNTDNRCHLWTVVQGEVTAIFHMGRRIAPQDSSGRASDPIAIECLKPGDSLLVPTSCRSLQWTLDSSEPAVLLDISGI